MRLPLILALSLLAHAGATVALGRWLPEHPDHALDLATTEQSLPHVQTTEPPASYYEITLLPSDPLQRSASTLAPAPTARASRTAAPVLTAAPTVGAAMAFTTATTSAPTGLPPTTEPTARQPSGDGTVLSMRSGPGKAMGRKPQLVLGSDAPATEQLAAVTADVPRSGLLSPTIGGGAVAHQGVFTAYVRRDGSFKIVDNPNFHIELALPSPRSLGRGISDWYANPDAAVRAEDSEREKANHQRSNSDDPKPDRGGTVPILKGGLDITAALMKGDAYLANKRRFLDATRAERVQIAARYQEQQLRDAGTMMRQRLAELSNQLVAPSIAKMTLFEMWDECADRGEPLVVRAGRDARLAVLGYIAVHFPRGSANAFSDDEVVKFNTRRRSTAAFVPYP